MHVQEVWPILQRDPFVPVRLCLSDGRRYEIHHPHMVIMSPRALAIGVRSNSDVGLAEHVVFCSLDHLVRVEILPPEEEKGPEPTPQAPAEAPRRRLILNPGPKPPDPKP